MKRSQIILLTLFLVITGVIYLVLKSNHKPAVKSMKSAGEHVFVAVKAVTNKERTAMLTSYGQIAPLSELMVSFEVQGRLLRGDVTMKPGTKFRTGQTLYRLDAEEAFFTFSARRAALSSMVLSVMPDIELDFPREKEKWLAFVRDLNPSKRLPELPPMTQKEQQFMASRSIVTEYFTLKSMEVRLDKYVYVAPFSGTVISTFAEPGAIVNPGVQIAQIARTGEFEVKVPVAIEHLDAFTKNSTTTFTDPSGNRIGTGKIVRVSDVVNQQTQSVDVYYSISADKGQHIYSGMYLNATIAREVTTQSAILPRTALKNGHVQRLNGNQIESLEITVTGTKPDSVFVSGLNDGDLILSDFITEPQEKTKYKGIQR